MKVEHAAIDARPTTALPGVPISLKESLKQAGYACTAGAAIRCVPDCVERVDGSLVTVSVPLGCICFCAPR